MQIEDPQPESHKGIVPIKGVGRYMTAFAIDIDEEISYSGKQFLFQQMRWYFYSGKLKLTQRLSIIN